MTNCACTWEGDRVVALCGAHVEYLREQEIEVGLTGLENKASIQFEALVAKSKYGMNFKTTQLWDDCIGDAPVIGALRVMWIGADGKWEHKGWLMPQVGVDV